MQRWGSEVSVVKNEGVHEADEETEEGSRFLVQVEYNGSGDWSGGFVHRYPHWNGTVGGLFNGTPVKLPNFNFLNTTIN